MTHRIINIDTLLSQDEDLSVRSSDSTTTDNSCQNNHVCNYSYGNSITDTHGNNSNNGYKILYEHRCVLKHRFEYIFRHSAATKTRESVMYTLSSQESIIFSILIQQNKKKRRSVMGRKLFILDLSLNKLSPLSVFAPDSFPCTIVASDCWIPSRPLYKNGPGNPN